LRNYRWISIPSDITGESSVGCWDAETSSAAADVFYGEL